MKKKRNISVLWVFAALMAAAMAFLVASPTLS